MKDEFIDLKENMNNPNEIFKTNGDADPLDECPSLQEYCLDILQLLSNCEAEMSYGNIGPAQCHIAECISLVKEMAMGDWKIRYAEGEI
jgi:hypothetical protein